MKYFEPMYIDGVGQSRINMQAIKHQKDTRLRDALAAEIEQLRKVKKITQQDLTDSKLSKVVRESTNMNISFVLSPERYDAYMIMPQIDKNNPIINFDRRGGYRSDAILAKMESGKSIITGDLDLESGAVSGVFAEIEGVVTLGFGFLEAADETFTARETAAVIVHELGHFFTYYLMLGTMTTTNYAILAALSDDNFGKETKRTKEILFALDGALRIHIPDKDNYKSRDASVLAATIVENVARRQKSEFGTAVFDERGCEVLADQFAARHGLGMDLVTALDKLHRMGGNYSYMSRAAQIILEVLKVSIFLLSVVSGKIILIPFVLGVLITNPTKALYDPPKARAMRIRDQVVSALKDRGISKERRKDLLSQIEAIDIVIADINEHDTFYEYMWKNVLPWGTTDSNKAKTQTELEQLLNNDLFVQSQKIIK